MRTKNILLLITLSLGGTSVLTAQDGLLSQYEMAPALLNPALTGMYEEGDFRMTSNVRTQWSSLATSFLTTGFAYDIAMDRRYGFGAYMSNYNMAGTINTFQFGTSAAYNISEKNAKHTLSAGVNLGLIYKKVNAQQMVWDAQYDGSYFNTDLPSGEFIDRGARLMPEVSVGIAYRAVNRNKTVNPFGNFALYHVTTPDESILRITKTPMHIRYSVNAGARIQIVEEVFLTPTALYWRQGADQMIQTGVVGEAGIPGSVYSAVVGTSYRWQDAVIIQVGLKHKTAMYGFSYDVNTSSLKRYTNKNGAFEFSIMYYGTHSGRDRRVQSKSF